MSLFLVDLKCYVYNWGSILIIKSAYKIRNNREKGKEKKDKNYKGGR